MKRTSRKGSVLQKSEEVCQQIEDWIHLKQYLDLLPSDYCYSFECDYSAGTQDYESQIYIQVGNESWVGTAYGNSEFASLAESLKRIETVESEDPGVNSQFQAVSLVMPH